MTKYCITHWGAILKVISVKDGLVWVSDPDAVDAGQDISTKEVDTYWMGFRPKDKLPEIGEPVEAITEARCLITTGFTKHGFEYDLQCQESVAIIGSGTPDKVILWRKPDSSF